MLLKVLLLLAARVVCSTILPTTYPPATTPPDGLGQTRVQVPRHMLVKPKTWKLGTTETLSLMIYNTTNHNRSIQAILFKRECGCRSTYTWLRRSRTCGIPVGDYKIFSRVESQAIPGQPTLLHIKLPSHDELTNNVFYFTVRSNLGEVFVDKQSISFSTNSRGMLVVKTDKPIYKPSQTIKFCVITLDATARPRPAVVSVRIQDPRSRKIEEWRSVNISDDGYKCLELELSDEPPLGSWRISVSETVKRSSCGYYSGLLGSCDFKVDTFVLPRFEVKVMAPDHISKKKGKVKGSVSALYVFGEPVEGTVTIKFTLEARARGESFHFHTITATLKAGRLDFNVPGKEYKRMLRYRFDPFCASSSIKIFAEVEEKGRGTKLNNTASVPLVANQVRFSFDEAMPRMFRPGMEYSVRIKSLLPGNLPARFKRFYLTVTANNGDLSIWTNNKTLRTDKRGEWMKSFMVPSGANCLKIVVRPVPKDQNSSCENINICLTPVAVFSPSSTYLQLTTSNSKPKINEPLKITATSNRNFEHVQCMVVARGQLLFHQSVESRGSSAVLEVTVSARHTPRFQVVCYVAQEDGEIVGDVLEIETECSLENKVAMTFHRDDDMTIVDEEDSVVPMTEVYVNVTSTPNTPVIVSVFDKSLSLLAGSCDIGKQSSVCRRLDSIVFGTIGFVDHSCVAEARTQCCPLLCQEPQKVDINRIISLLGINVMTNMYLPSAPVTATVPPRRPGFFPPSFTGDVSEDLSRTDDEDGEVRRLFPESWLFEVIETGTDGHGKLPSTVPDTITTWVGQGVALSKEEGIGFSNMASLTVFKSFFVSLELPYSVNLGETLIIKPFVFNFLTNSVMVTLSINLHSDLSLLGQEPGPLPIQAESSNSFTLRILPRTVGRLPIRISAQLIGMNIQDVVEKLLYVKTGCVRYEKIDTLIAESNGQATFDVLQLPTCTIPGSQKVSITITGDLMSPPNLDNLLVVPSGCGEQNLVKTTNNFVVANYLDSTEQLTGAIAARVRANIMKGYQRELIFQLVSGAFAVWPGGVPSVWLTAFALGSFSDIAHFYGNVTFIDEGIMDTAFSYLLRKQNEGGCFALEGTVHNYRLLNGNAPITAYVLIALKRYEMLKRTNAALKRSIDQATHCLLSYTTINAADICTYTLALSSYALAVQRENGTTINVITQLKSEIRPSVAYPGTCYVCNSCTARSDAEMEQKCEGESPRSDPITSDCVETTAYTLLALLELGDTDRTGCLAQWLIKQQNSFGSFGSSQDTIMGLKALAAFSKRTFTPEMNLTFEVETESLREKILINNENRYVRHKAVVSNITSSTAVSWSGEGTALVQSVLSYHGCDCCNSSDCFQLTAKSVAAPLNSVTMETCFSYQCGNKSNMAILDVQILSGCIFETQTVIRGDVVIQRVDVSGDSVVLYMDEVTGKTSCVKLQYDVKFEVKDRQPLAFTIYDYYMPTERVSVFVDKFE